MITDFKTGKSDSAGPPRDSLQLGIYYLAVQESPDLAEFQPVRTVELAFLRGNWKSPNIDYRKWMVTERDEDAYQARDARTLATLIARKRELNEREVYRPNPYANCRFCDFQTLCPLYAGGSADVLRSSRSAPEHPSGCRHERVVPTRDRRRAWAGRRPPTSSGARSRCRSSRAC